MNVGLKVILLAVAIILFVIAVFSDENWPDLVALGLACVAGALAAEELGYGKTTFGSTGAGTRRDVT